VAQHPGRVRAVVDGGADLHPLARLGVWERLLELAQRRGRALGMVFLDCTGIRAHHKAAGAGREGAGGEERDVREALDRSRGG
jgi:hypothetical protein